MNRELENIYDANNLMNAYRKCKSGTDWKESVQRYEAYLLLNILDTMNSLKSETYKPKVMTTFELCERGHKRQIKAQHIADRVVQRSFNDNVLIPKVRPKLIYDNGASLKDKGLHFARKRFEIHLRNAYRKWGKNAVVWKLDFTGYFDNIQHDKLIKQFEPILNASELRMLKQVCKQFEIDVSYMNDEEYADCMNTPFKALIYDKTVPPEKRTGRRFMPKSMGIGNQSSQIAGVFYPHIADNYCKIVKGIKEYDRYMDDTAIIFPNIKEYHKLRNELEALYKSLGIFINKKKSRIHKITDWITWLKINYRIKPDTGGLIRTVHNSTIRRERRKLRKLYHLYRAGKISLSKVTQCYKSWCGAYRKYDSGAKIHRLDIYFSRLFKEEKQHG